MPQLEDMQRTLGWCLLGLLLTYVLINVIGFISPLWALWWHEEPSKAGSLLHFWRPIAGWFSILFLAGSWHLSKTVRSTVARIGVLAMGALVVVAEVGSGFALRDVDQAESEALAHQLEALDIVASAYLGFAALVFIALIWHSVRQSNNSFKPNPLRGSA